MQRVFFFYLFLKCPCEILSSEKFSNVWHLKAEQFTLLIVQRVVFMMSTDYFNYIEMIQINDSKSAWNFFPFLFISIACTNFSKNIF